MDIAVYETNETGEGGRVSRYICVYVLFLVLSRNAFSLFHCFSCVHVMEKGYPGTLGSLSLSLSRSTVKCHWHWQWRRQFGTMLHA